MGITRTTMIDDDGSGTTGTILNNAWLQTIYNQIDGDPVWTAIPFNAANFSASGGMTWTVGAAAVLFNRYAVVGKVLFWSFYISWYSGANVLGGTPSATLKITVPPGVTPVPSDSVAISFCGGISGVPAIVGLYGSSAVSTLDINKANNSNYALSDVPGMITLVTLGLQ